MRLDLYAEGGYSGGGITENGGNISGPLLLAGNPSQTLEAVPKQYVDAYYNSINAGNLTAGTLHASRLPNFTGDLQSSAGSTQLTLNNSEIVAGEYSKVTVNSKGIVTAGSNISNSDIPFGLNWSKINAATLPSTLSGYGITNGVNVAGATMLGFLTISQSPTLGTHIATKQYVDSLISSGGIAVGDILRKPYATTPVGFLKCNGAEVDKITYSSLYAVIGDQYKQNTVPGNGQPWRQQYQINNTQTDDITGWATSGNLPSTLANPQAVVTKNRVYLFGPWLPTGLSAVCYTAPINADGTLGTWTTGTSLPGILSQSQSIVTKNRVYLLGGHNGSVNVSTVYTAPINSDGTIGTWTTDASLPSPTGISQAFVTKNRVYVCGGTSGNNSIYLSTVYTAPINSDGTIGTWTTDASLPNTLAFAQPIITKNRVYLVGGISNAVIVSTVYTAVINADGTLGAWSQGIPLPSNLTYSQSIVTKNRVYLLGGMTSSNIISTVYTAPINADGTLGTWGIGTNLSNNLDFSTVITTKNNIHLLGGCSSVNVLTSNIMSCPINGGLNDYSPYYAEDTTNYMMPGSGKPWQQQYQINTTQSGEISGWTTTTALPATISDAQVFATKNRVYLCGGNDGVGMLSTVRTAPINADGTLGTWSTSGSLPDVLRFSSVVVTKNRVYLLGGNTSVATNGAVTAAVYTAAIMSDGTIAAWSVGTSLPVAMQQTHAFITKNRIYLCRGYNGTAVLTTVYTAVINPDGTIGTWSSGAALPAAVCNAQAIVTKNRVYLCGGNNGSVISNVYTASINSDGILGLWVYSPPLPGILQNSQALVFKNRAYLIGGHNGSGATAVVYTAAINPDGSLSSWTTSNSIPVAAHLAQVVVTKGRVYALGGWSGAVLSTVQTAAITGNIQDYTPYYDGSIVPIDLPVTSNTFILPDLSADEPFGSYSYIKY